MGQMPRLFTVLFLAKLLSSAQCNDECCYAYGSVPINDTNCVPEGQQIALHYIIYNPHDTFTNVSVTWYRSTTEDRSTYEPLSEEYWYVFHQSPTSVKVIMTNCSLNIYRDVHGIVIQNFTREKNGYYWCQLAINNTYTQPSYYAWFYASQTCSPLNYHYFRLASLNETQCAQYVANTSPFITPTLLATTSNSMIPTASQITLADSTISQISSPGSSNEKLLIYIILGSFSAFLLIALLGVLLLASSLAFYVHHLRKKSKHQQKATPKFENEEYDDICAERGAANKEENHVYQTLKLNEMNYESMYAKIIPIEK